MRRFRIHGETRFGVPAMTVEAKSAGDIERQDHTVALLDALHRFSHGLDNSHNFVPNHGAFFQRSAPVIHMQVAAANAARRDAHQRIGRRLQFRFRSIAYRHRVSTFIRDSLHDCLHKWI